MIAPRVHANGTSAEALLDGLLEQSRALRKAIDALSTNGPNARDYYVQATQSCPNPFEQAQREHALRIAKLREVAREIEELTENVCDQRDAREKKR